MWHWYALLMIIILMVPMRGTSADMMHYSPIKPAPFVLLVMLYNENKPERVAEYIQCMEINMRHEWIDTIHVLYDTTADNGVISPLHEYLKRLPITISYVSGRATFGDFFNLANNNYQARRIIISNADIYFNHTLAYLLDYDLRNKFLAIGRWDVQSDGQLIPFNRYYGDSQDVWIFQSPLRKFAHDRIQLGLLDCDGRIAFQAQKVGLSVINPSKTIQCCHVHNSGIRNYGPRMTPYPKHEALLVHGKYL